MKVLMLMGGAEEGGLEKHFVELASGLANQCEMLAVAHKRYADRFTDTVQFQRCDLSRSRRNPVMLWQLLRVIRREKPDLVHAQGSKAARILAYLKKWLNCPCIASVHGLKRKNSFYSKLDRVICVSQGVADQLGTDNCSVIYNGITPPAGQPFKQAQPRVLAVGRLVPEKGFDVLIEAWQQIDQPLDIAGDGPERAALQQQIEDLGLQQRITLLGHRDDVAALIARSQLVVISSRREGFNYVFAESLLAHRPLIATDVPVANEVLAGDLLVPVEDAQMLARRLSKALQDPGAYYQIFEPYFEYAAQHFSLQAMLINTFNLYQTVVAEHG